MGNVNAGARHLLSMGDLSAAETLALTARAREIKTARLRSGLLEGRTVALLFEKPSLRTRVSFEVATANLGGRCIYLSPQEVGIGAREAVSDVAQVLSRYVDCIVYRCYAHATLAELAHHATVPVINALSDHEHPCQTLADLTTALERRGALAGTTLAYIGDGNNVARSLGLGCAAVGMEFRIASPEGYGLTADDEEAIGRAAAASGGAARFLRSPQEAAAGAHVLYTDVWASMGQEAEAAVRREDFAGYQVNPELLAHAAPGAIFLHDLPAHYGEEVPHGFLDHPQSAVFDQAENRLHAQQALLEALLGQP